MAAPKELPGTVTIIGAGVFGLSTAIALAERSLLHNKPLEIHVIDKEEPPVSDGSSVDTSRCLRMDYMEDHHFKLAKESIGKILADDELSKLFDQCGMSMVYDGDEEGEWHEMYITEKKSCTDIIGERMRLLDTPEDVFRSIHGQNRDRMTIETLGRPTQWNKGYCNPDSGFIEASRAVELFYKKACKYDSIKFSFTPVKRLIFTEETSSASGVELEDGSYISSDLIIVAAGAWSSKLVDLRDVTTQSAIEVAWFPVTEVEAKSLSGMAITTNETTGLNTFPPFEGEVKVLRRSSGYANTVTVPHPLPGHSSFEVSVPRTLRTNPKDWIPKEAEEALRFNMAEIFPFLKDRPFSRTKMCWVTQTPTSNFLVDYHPDLENVVVVTGDSAHGWKFVGVIGDKVVDLITGKLDPELKYLWSWEEKIDTKGKEKLGGAGRLPGQPKEMSVAMRSGPDN